ncbi:MAG: HAMP domain-containing histidine kinase [Paracoccaceae bacterium]|nr:MAG: HAMP domain-containing histidine kinase [Paracoccaceae bacterium]
MSRPRPRVTLRLAGVVAVAITVLSLAGMVLQYRLVEARLMEQARSLLSADLDGLAALYDQRRIIALRQAIDYRAAAALADEMLWLGDRAGGRLAGTRAEWPAAMTPAGEGFSAEAAQVFADGGTRWLGVARTLPGGFPLIVARSLAGVDATLAALRRAMAAITLGMLAMGAGVGWLAARGPMRRIARLNGLADRVAGGDLAARLPGVRPDDEFGLLETHVHAMLDRIEALNRATHRLSDTIAHELRTPLNRMAQKLGAIAGQDDVVDDLRAEMRAAVRVFDALLDISRAEADTGGGGLLPLDLSALVAEMAELYGPVAEDAGMTVTAAAPPGLTVLGDSTLIGQMIANLLDNAVKYCRPGDRIDLALVPERETIRLTLADTGPGLPADLRETAFDRFTRGGAPVPGHGLGLALVRAIAARHGARIVLPPTTQGFAIHILWPRLPAD